MKKVLTVNLIFVLLLLCGCADGQENTDTRFLMDTFVTLSADCSPETIADAFDRCAELERLLSRTAADSDVSRLNRGEDFAVSAHTLTVLRRALSFAELSGGKFDVTVCPVSMLWDFKNQVVPSKDEIAAALKNVDYHSVSVQDDRVSLGGKMIDLGGIAKGYITDEAVKFLRQNGVQTATFSCGSNVYVLGGKMQSVGIKKPFSDGEICAVLSLKNKSVATSGTYERYLERDGVLYHHILDPKTGYGVQTDLASASIISKNAMDGDALATVCILLGKEKAQKLIEATPDTEAVFVESNGNVSVTDGLRLSGGKYVLK